jgi:hypothetical protein
MGKKALGKIEKKIMLQKAPGNELSENRLEKVNQGLKKQKKAGL